MQSLLKEGYSSGSPLNCGHKLAYDVGFGVLHFSFLQVLCFVVFVESAGFLPT